MFYVRKCLLLRSHEIMLNHTRSSTFDRACMRILSQRPYRKARIYLPPLALPRRRLVDA